jgi:hypothetical protein
MNNTIVARYLDGRLLKGTSLDIHPSRPTFHVRPPGERAVKVNLAELKAVFYVRTLEGDASRAEDLTPNPEDSRSRGSNLVRLQFQDGEVMVGLSNGSPSGRPYFFIVPVDARSNNLRILVNQAAVASLEEGLKMEPVPSRAAS